MVDNLFIIPLGLDFNPSTTVSVYHAHDPLTFTAPSTRHATVYYYRMKLDALKLFNQLKSYPGGKWVFSKAVSYVAPYFRTFSPYVEDLKHGFCEVHVKKRWGVTNHIGTVHAIAMCNAAELAAGVMTDVSIPKTHRWIPAGMTVKYVKKAQTNLTTVADGSNIDWVNPPRDLVVPVVVTDTRGDVVFTAAITMNVSLNKKKEE